MCDWVLGSWPLVSPAKALSDPVYSPANGLTWRQGTSALSPPPSCRDAGGIVGAGASVRKEGAPREIGALLAGRLAKGFSLALKERKVLIACGAGAGLAAVYQVPFASSLFVFETLGLAYSWQNFLLVLTSTYLATWVAQSIVGQEAIYHLSAVSWSASSFLQAIVIAFLVTPLGSGLCFPRQAG